jgi:hypothetical protein
MYPLLTMVKVEPAGNTPVLKAKLPVPAEIVAWFSKM